MNFPSDKYPARVQHAVTWRIASEIMRRYSDHIRLKLFEAHPAGGQGDTLVLARWSEDGHWDWVNDFRGWRRLGKEPVWARPPLEDSGGYVDAFLRSSDAREVINAIDEMLGLSPRRGPKPPSSPSTLAYRAMAEVLNVGLTSRHSLQWRSAFLDTSAMMGSQLRKAVEGIPALARLDFRSEDSGNLWLLVQESTGLNPPADAVHLVVDANVGRVLAGRNLGEWVDLAEKRSILQDLPSLGAWLLRESRGL